MTERSRKNIFKVKDHLEKFFDGNKENDDEKNIRDIYLR